MIYNSDRMVAAEDGSFISERVATTIQAIREYDPTIDVEWIPNRDRKPDEPAFRLIHRRENGEHYVMFHVKDESEFDTRVLHKIIMNDPRSRHGDVKYSDLEAWEEAEKRVKKQAWEDQMEELNDMAAHVLRSHLNTYTLPGGIKIRDTGDNVHPLRRR